MGEVYRARDAKLDREVAIKVLPAHLTDNAEALGRLEREAKAIAALSHPNILAIHDFGKIDGVTFAVMELLEGESLGTRLKRRGRLPVDEAARVARDALLSLAEAHDKGIIHRDLKPDNLFLTRAAPPAQGEIAKVALDLSAQGRLTIVRAADKMV